MPIRRESSANELKIYSPFCGTPESLVNYHSRSVKNSSTPRRQAALLTPGVEFCSSLPRCPPIHKSHSLPRGCEERSCELFSFLQTPPEDFASQLTQLDIVTFRCIAPEELSSCAWSKKNKLEVAPNVVAFTRRFNHVNADKMGFIILLNFIFVLQVSFWTVEEILSGDTPKKRAEIIALFIRIAKKLYELNNLHSLFAIISALQSASVFR